MESTDEQMFESQNQKKISTSNVDESNQKKNDQHQKKELDGPKNGEQQKKMREKETMEYQKALLETKLNFYREKDRQYKQQIKELTEENEKIKADSKENICKLKAEFKAELMKKDQKIQDLEEKLKNQEELTNGIESFRLNAENLRKKAVEQLEKMGVEKIEIQRQINEQRAEIQYWKQKEFETNQLAQSKQAELNAISKMNAKLKEELEEMKMNGNIQQEQEWNYNDQQQHGEEEKETEELEENSSRIFNEQNYENGMRKRHQIDENSDEFSRKNVRNAKKKAFISITANAETKQLNGEYDFDDDQDGQNQMENESSSSSNDIYNTNELKKRTKRGSDSDRPKKPAGPMTSATLQNNQQQETVEEEEMDTTEDHWTKNGKDGHFYSPNCQECKRIYGI